MPARFPAALATDADLLIAKNRAQTTLVANLNASDTAFTLASDAFGVNVAITIDSEIIVILAKSGASVTSCVRGFDGTAASSHVSGKLVSAYIDAWHHNQVSLEIQALEASLGVALGNVTALIPNPTPVNKGGTGAATAATARTNLGAAASGANGDITSLTGLTTPLPVPQGGTGVATLTGIVQGNGVSVQSAIAAALPGQVLRRKWNSGTVPAYEFASMAGGLLAGDYHFAAQSPAGSLAIGANSITLTPVPPGVNGADANHYLYISGGTGTAEAVLISGGTAVAGGASGTLIITCANTHTGAWTIQSAAGGIPEAIQYAIDNQSGAARIAITQIVTAYAPSTVAAGAFIHIQGSGTGAGAMYIVRAANFTVGHILRVTAAQMMVSDLYISAGASTAPYAAIEADTAAVITVKNVYVNGTLWGIICDGAATVLINGFQFGNFSANVATAGIQLGPGGCSNVIISNVFVVGLPLASILHCILILYVDGVLLSNLWLSGRRGISVSPAAGQTCYNLYVEHFLIDSFLDAGIIFDSVPTSGSQSIHFANGHVNAQHAVGSNASGIDLGYTIPAKVDNCHFSNINIYDCPRDGVRIGLLNSPQAIEFSGMQIFNNNAQASAYHGIRVAAGASGIRIRNSTIGNKSSTAGQHVWGIALEGNVTDMMIEGNDLSQNSSGPVFSAGTFAGVMANNKGLDDVAPAAASGATVTLPFHPTFTITGTTGIGAVTNIWEGRKVTIVTTSGAVTFTAGATIGNTMTTAQNVPVTGIVVGGKLYLK